MFRLTWDDVRHFGQHSLFIKFSWEIKVPWFDLTLKELGWSVLFHLYHKNSPRTTNLYEKKWNNLVFIQLLLPRNRKVRKRCNTGDSLRKCFNSSQHKTWTITHIFFFFRKCSVQDTIPCISCYYGNIWFAAGYLLIFSTVMSAMLLVERLDLLFCENTRWHMLEALLQSLRRLHLNIKRSCWTAAIQRQHTGSSSWALMHLFYITLSYSVSYFKVLIVNVVCEEQ